MTAPGQRTSVEPCYHHEMIACLIDLNTMQHDTSPVLTQPCTHRGAERYALLLEVATALFIEHGFDHVSLDQIMEQAGGSKATIYKYFGNKKGLLLAICEQRRQRFIVQIEHACSQQHQVDIRHNLIHLLHALYQVFNDEKGAALARLLFTVSQRDPELAHELYQHGPLRARQLMADLLRQAHQRGELYCTQPEDSAIFFFGFFHDLLWRSLAGLPVQDSQPDMKKHIQYVVERFIAGHQPPAAVTA